MIATNLKNARLDVGLSRRRVSEYLSVTERTIYRWETGDGQPDLGQAERLADLYRVTLDELVAHSQEENR